MSWIIPALKAVLPHMGTIIATAAPVFTKMKGGAADEQIIELQQAASENATHIRELAAQFQKTVSALEQAALVTEARLRTAVLLSVVATGVSAVSLGFALYVVYS
jgi:hypothetical protein